MRFRIAIVFVVLAAACGGGGAMTRRRRAARRSRPRRCPTTSRPSPWPRPATSTSPVTATSSACGPTTPTSASPCWASTTTCAPSACWPPGGRLSAPNTWRFELRRGVTFHNGAPFNAEAVRSSMARVVAKSLGLTSFLGADSTKVVDEFTVDITPTQTNLRFPEQIAHPNFSMIAPGTDPADQPVCTGPFKFGEYAPNDHFTAVRHDGYWGEKAKLRQLTFRFIPDQNTRRLALESGQVDGIYFLAPQQAANVKARADFQLAPTPPGATVVLSFNLHGENAHTLMQDIDLRRALAWSLDPEGLAEQQWQGTAQPITTVSPPAVLGPAAAQVRSITNDLAEGRGAARPEGLAEGRRRHPGEGRPQAVAGHARPSSTSSPRACSSSRPRPAGPASTSRSRRPPTGPPTARRSTPAPGTSTSTTGTRTTATRPASSSASGTGRTPRPGSSSPPSARSSTSWSTRRWPRPTPRHRPRSRSTP